LNIHIVYDVRQREIHTIEALVPQAVPFEIEIAIANLQKYVARYESSFTRTD
jgi:hypothetical protein